MPTKMQRTRLDRLAARRRGPSRIFVTIGDGPLDGDGPVYTLGGVPTAERPGPDDIVIKLEYEQAPVTNPAALAREPAPTVPDVVVPSVVHDEAGPRIDPESRIGKAYGVGDPWRRRRYHTPADE